MALSLENFRVEINPEMKYVHEFNDIVIKTENFRNRTGTEVPIGRASFEEFYYIMAFEKDSDAPVGAISVAKDKVLTGKSEDDLFYIGSFFVKEECRGIGLGKKMFKIALELTNGGNVCLNAAGKNNEIYEKKHGFIQYNGIHFTKATLDTKRMHPDSEIDCEGYQIMDVSGVYWSKIVKYDEEISGRAREKYLRLWMTAEGAVSKIAVDPKSGFVVGFACARPQIQNRLVVGPFYAENGTIAKILIHKLLAIDDLKKYDEVWFRFPPTNSDSIPVLDSLIEGDYPKLVTTMAQFNKKFVDYEKNRVFSVFEPAHSII